jgi:hypothetical protein
METSTETNVANAIEKFNQIASLISEIEQIDSLAGNILREFYTLACNTMVEIGKLGGRPDIDISEQIAIIGRVLGVDLQAMMEYTIKEMSGETESNKEADSATLDFITSDLDDYERFVAQAKAKESLDFLSKEI